MRKKHIFLHCNASNLVLKILQHDKIWGDNPPLQILRGRGICPPHLPVIYAHEYRPTALVTKLLVIKQLLQSPP